MKVKLSHAPNPDLRGGYWQGCTKPKRQTVEVKDFAEASRVCRQYIEENDLGGGNWTGGQVCEGAKQIARISYNGRIWDMEGKEII
jgi:hypothetical protein